jgi:hypothetical protein
MARAKQKMPPDKIPCPCNRKDGRTKAWLKITYPRTTHDGRVCTICGRAVLTCHWCYGIICDWNKGEPNSELSYMPPICPKCGAILHTRGLR